MGDDERGAGRPSPFKYHLELTPAQLKLTHTALSSLLDDFGHEEREVGDVIRAVLDKLPDEHAIRAIRLEDELEGDAGAAREPEPESPRREPGGDEPPDSVA